MKISPTPWKRDEYGSIRDATGERISLTGCALSTGRVRPDDECHGNTALLFAAPLLLAYYRASKNLQMTLGHPDATAQDEHEAEAAYAAASRAAADAVGLLGAA